MSKWFASVLLIFAFLTVLVNVSEAARFGGRSFGAQRMGNFYRAQSTNRVYSQAARPPRSGWISPLTGMAMGGLMAYLFMGHGLGSSLLSWFLILSLIAMVRNFFRAKTLFRTQADDRPLNRGRVFDAESYRSKDT